MGRDARQPRELACAPMKKLLLLVILAALAAFAAKKVRAA